DGAGFAVASTATGRRSSTAVPPARTPARSWADTTPGTTRSRIGSVVTLSVNLVGGVVLMFFTIDGSRSDCPGRRSAFNGLHGAAASAVRFLSGAVFHRVPYERTLSVMVVVSGLSVAAIGGVRAQP